MPAQLDRLYTREEVLAFPEDGNRYELVHGELLVSPSPRVPHQRVLGQLQGRLFAYCGRHGAGEVLSSPADLSWGLGDVLVQPDLFVTGPRHTGATEWHEMREFPLVIEVLSPSTARHDRFTKRRLYQELRVPLYWVVDVAARRVEVWTPDATRPVYVTDTLTWQPEGVAEPFVVDIAALLGT